MATPIDWSGLMSAKKSRSGKGGVEFIKFESGKARVVRPIGEPVEFIKFFISGTKRSVVVDPEFADQAAAALSAHAGKEIRGSRRFAVNVIDRADGKFRVLEAGPQVFQHFGNWSIANDKSPIGGHAGFDWSILANGDGLDRQYVATPLKHTAFTKDEIDRAKNKKEVYSLKEVYASCPLDEVVKRAFGDNSSSQDDGATEPAMVSAEGFVNDSINF